MLGNSWIETRKTMIQKQTGIKGLFRSIAVNHIDTNLLRPPSSDNGYLTGLTIRICV